MPVYWGTSISSSAHSLHTVVLPLCLMRERLSYSLLQFKQISKQVSIAMSFIVLNSLMSSHALTRRATESLVLSALHLVVQSLCSYALGLPLALSQEVLAVSPGDPSYVHSAFR